MKVFLFCSLVLPTLLATDAPLSFILDRFEDRGGDFPLVFYKFQCGSRHYTFCPPAAWKIAGDAASMSFSLPTGDGDAVARFRVSSPTELALLNPDQSTRRESALRQYLPPGASEITQVGTENTNPAPMLAHKGTEIVYRFNFFGHAQEASIMICQLDAKNGFTLVMVAPAGIGDDFIASVHRTLGTVGVVEDRSPGDLH